MGKPFDCGVLWLSFFFFWGAVPAVGAKDRNDEDSWLGYNVNNCGVNSIVTVLALSGRSCDPGDLRAVFGNTVRKAVPLEYGLSLDEICEVLEKYGLRCRALKGCAVRDVMALAKVAIVMLRLTRVDKGDHLIVLGRCAGNSVLVCDYPRRVRWMEWHEVDFGLRRSGTGEAVVVCDLEDRSKVESVMAACVGLGEDSSDSGYIEGCGGNVVGSGWRATGASDATPKAEPDIDILKEISVPRGTLAEGECRVLLEIVNRGLGPLRVDRVVGECACLRGSEPMTLDVPGLDSRSIQMIFDGKLLRDAAHTRVAVISNDPDERIAAVDVIVDSRPLACDVRIVPSIIYVRGALERNAVVAEATVFVRGIQIPDSEAGLCYNRNLFRVELGEARDCRVGTTGWVARLLRVVAVEAPAAVWEEKVLVAQDNGGGVAASLVLRGEARARKR